MGDRKHLRECIRRKKSDSYLAESDLPGAQPSAFDASRRHSIASARSFSDLDGDNDSVSIDLDSMVKFDAKSRFNSNKRFLKKIPAKSEVANVLIGEVDWLDDELSVLIRLNRSMVIDNFSEVPLPTKFIFFHLGPPGSIGQLRELGKCMATLFSDEVREKKRRRLSSNKN